MKKFLVIIFTMLLLSGCQSVSTLPDGKKAACVGINNQKDSQYIYEYSVRNIVVGIIFIEMIIPPVVIIFSELWCPVAYATQEKK